MRRILAAAALAAIFSVLPDQQAFAQSCANNIPHVNGTWEVLPYQMPINPISANVLPSGKVLIVAGSENDAKNNSKGAESYRAAVWDPTGTTQSSIKVQNLTYDVFCSGTAALLDGRSLVVGGTSDYTFTGDNRASFFDWKTERFAQSQSMAQGRWYASAITLGDGSIMAMSGLTTTGGTSSQVEIYYLNNAGVGWKPPQNLGFTPPLYPRIFMLTSGNVFYNGQGSGGFNATGYLRSPVTGAWTASVPTTMNRYSGSSVMLPLLPPDYAPRIMNFGGGSPATASTEIVDMSSTTPTWTAGPNMSSGRIQMNAVLLPNGKVLAEGGSANNESPSAVGRIADLYDSATNTMSSAGTAAYSRLYHSVALLLPDARVVSMGSNPGPRGTYEAAAEIYTPPYLYDSNDHLITTNRPSITAISPASGVRRQSEFLTVSYTSTNAITSAVLVRPGSATHAFDMEQRLIVLCGPNVQPTCSESNNSLTLQMPPTGNVAPPGYYMLFLLDSAGVPSKAQFIQLTPFATVPPTGTITSPALNTTITAGQAVAFGTTTTASKYSWVFPGGLPAISTAQNPGNVVFNTPGTYEVSFTVVDSSGNTDAHPPTRTITVLPTTPDFNITVSPPAVEVAPGGTATFTVNVTPLSGFTGAVGLAVGSENPFPGGVTSGSFSPATINGSGSSTFTMSASTTAVITAVSLTVTGTSGSLTHTASTTLLVNLLPPASLSATAGDKQVALSWPASVDATSYLVKRGLVTGGPYRTVACPASTSYTDTGLVDGTTYYYVVSGLYAGNPNAGGASSDSTETAATPKASVSPPPAPTGLTASAGSGQVTLAWSASAGATSYKVKRSTTSGGPYTTISNPTATGYTDLAVTNGTTYYYVVSAVNSSNVESGNSSQVQATPTTALPAAPTSLSVKSNKPGTIDLTWIQSTSAGVTRNSIYRRSGSGTSTLLTTINATTTYRDPNLARGASFCYRVTAINAAGQSTQSTESCGSVR